MKIIKPQALSLLTRPYEFKREFWLGVTTVAFLPIGEEQALLPETAMWPFLAEELPPEQPLDASIPKEQAEFVATAHAYAPGGNPVTELSVGIQLGPVIKTLNVWGDREIDGDRVSAPVPFTTLPIDWAHAYGGKDVADNPLGKGAAPLAGTDGQVFAIPNILDPKRAETARYTPSGFGPIDPMWPARSRWRGTYDDAWLKQDFPGFARDTDWRHFNIAPDDQWLPNGLAGDETYAFKNLHPTQPLLKGRLPGIAPRAFLVRKGQEDDGFEEVGLTLTTIWFFPHRERLVMVHHGRARLAEEDASDIARIVLGADPLGALRPAAAFHAVMMKRLDRKTGVLHTLRDDELVPAAWLRPDPALAVKPDLAQQQIFARARKRMEREHANQREAVRARGLDPDKYSPPPLAPPPPLPDMDDLPTIVAEAEAEAEAQKAKAEREVAARKAEMAKQLASAGVPDAEIEKRLNAKPKGPPSFSEAKFRAEITQQMTAMRVLGQLTLGLEAQLASPEFGAKLQQAEAALRNAYRLSAHHQAAADPQSSERSIEIRRLIAGDSKAARAMYDLHGADLSGLDLSGLDVSGVCLDGANLTGTSFARANLTDAVLAHAIMAGCVLDGANLSGANLGHAQLNGASLRGAVLKKVVLANADLTGASLIGADLAGADLSDAILAGADLSGVRAPDLLAMNLNLRRLRAPGAVLTKAKFIECDLEDADLTGASMDQVMFLKTNLAGIRLTGANLRKAVFVQQSSLAHADLSSADLTGANLRETQLPRANLDKAILENADFSFADLTDGVLTRVRGANSRFVAARLRYAKLRGADLSQADLSRADLRGADLTEVSVYEANLARVQLDRETRRRGMFTTRMRYLPTLQQSGTS